jgi:hypothetical protein
MTFRITAKLCLSLLSLLLVFSLVLSGNLVEAKPDTKNSNASTPKKKWASIKGFRSAKFGMTEKQVSRAISKDFKISSSKTKRTENSLEKTVVLGIEVPELLKAAGPAKISYTFGYKSKKLIQVAVLWGTGATPAQNIVNTANLLRVHLLKKQYLDGAIANAKVSDTSTIVFRGSDKEKRMAVLVLTTPTPNKDQTNKTDKSKVTLKLSYILNPSKPDIFTINIKEGDF